MVASPLIQGAAKEYPLGACTIGGVWIGAGSPGFRFEQSQITTPALLASIWPESLLSH